MYKRQLFSYAARHVTLATVGIVQYLSPSINFLLAVTVMGEAIKPGDMVTFPLIWSALALYTWDALRSMRRLKAENAARFAARAEAVDESPLS